VWSIPDKGEGLHDNQSILFQEYLDVLIAALQGIDCVLSGCDVTAQGSPDMTVAVSKGAVLSNGVLRAVTGGNVNIGAADGSNPRFDLVVVDSTGAKQVRAGTAAAAPKPPARSANDVVLAAVYVPANDTTIASNQIVGLRVIRGGGGNGGGGGAPIIIKKETAAATFSNTAAAQIAFTVTVPSGLFLIGQILRVRLGGTMVLNSGTPTVRIEILYGGTVMFSDISGASTADADAIAWHLDLELVARANNAQRLAGDVSFASLAAKTAPTTGTGDAWATVGNTNPIAGTAAVDSDAGDRAFEIRFTMSVANAANTWTCDYATAELV
jgi:hypothetical protein